MKPIKFKVGDDVYYIDFAGKKNYCTITRITDEYSSEPSIWGYWAEERLPNKRSPVEGWMQQSKVFLVENKLINKNIMKNLIERARLLAKGEPEKSLTQKGITDINDILTADGEQLFKDFLYRANKAAFVADPTIKALLDEKDEK